MSQHKKIIIKICSKTKTKFLGFNENLIRIHFFKEHEFLSFEFLNISMSGLPTRDTFDIGSNGCDLDYFEEFGNSCIAGFKGSELDNQTIIEKSREIYHTIIKFMEPKEQQKKSDLALLEEKQKMAFNKAKNKSFLINDSIIRSAIIH